MTAAPASLIAARDLLRAHLGIPLVGLGIVGDPAHRGGYHCGSDRTVSGDYSVTESSRDAKPTLSASALDIGSFDVTVAGKRHTLRTLSLWLVEQCAANAPDTRDIREVIYSPDGKTVRRWDRLRRRTTGDSSHLYHTHISYHRDSEARSKAPLFRRYLVEIGRLADDMTTKAEFVGWLRDAEVRRALAEAVLNTDNVIPAPGSPKPGTTADGKPVNTHWALLSYIMNTYNAAVSARTYSAEARTLAATASGRDPVDPAEIAQHVLAGLDPARIAAAVPADIARQVADELTRRLVD